MPSPYEDREQTEVKHRVLERYLEAFIPIVGGWAEDITYIDCLAGPWESVDPKLDDTSFSRAIKTIRSTREILRQRGKGPSIRCLFIEKEPSRYARLKQYCDQVTDIEVHPMNWDFMEHVDDVVRFALERGKGSFPFIFLDPTGWEQLDIALVSPILRLNPGEVLINLMTSWITRFLSDESKHWDRLVGSDLSKLVSLLGEEREDQLVRSYAAKVQQTGQFSYVCTLPILKADQDTFHYHMIYGTRHQRGVEVFKDVEKTVIPFMHETRAHAQQRRRFANTGQYSFLPPGDLYRESRFSRFRQRNVGQAREDIRALLESKTSIDYETAWFKAMQYSAVSERDLREWLESWRTEGSLKIVNLLPTQKVLSKGRNHILQWIANRREP
jgi:three-Cys-motif partner protein